MVAFERCGNGGRGKVGRGFLQGAGRDFLQTEMQGTPPFPHQQMSSSFSPATVVTSLQCSLHPGFSGHSPHTSFNRPPRCLTTKGVTLLCTLAWNTQTPTLFQAPCFVLLRSRR